VAGADELPAICAAEIMRVRALEETAAKLSRFWVRLQRSTDLAASRRFRGI
jgi:hypothetical protein